MADLMRYIMTTLPNGFYDLFQLWGGDGIQRPG